MDSDITILEDFLERPDSSGVVYLEKKSEIFGQNSAAEADERLKLSYPIACSGSQLMIPESQWPVIYKQPSKKVSSILSRQRITD